MDKKKVACLPHPQVSWRFVLKKLIIICCYNLYFVYVHSIREDEKKGIVTLHMQGGEKGTIT